MYVICYTSTYIKKQIVSYFDQNDLLRESEINRQDKNICFVNIWNVSFLNCLSC